jgi:hypothetical protein
MERSEIIAGLLSVYRRPRYLEVGVYSGDSFLPQRARRKVAVDPSFKFEVAAARAKDSSAEFHEVESDTYFGRIAGRGDRFHVIFLDGLHTFEQTLRDFLNAAERLEPGGVIVLDDVRPSSELAALPDWGEAFQRSQAPDVTWNGDWMGDVYRVLLFIDSFVQGFTYRTVQETGGQTVLWRETRPVVARRQVGVISALPYEALGAEQASYNFAPYAAIREQVARHAAAHGRGRSPLSRLARWR